MFVKYFSFLIILLLNEPMFTKLSTKIQQLHKSLQMSTSSNTFLSRRGRIGFSEFRKRRFRAILTTKIAHTGELGPKRRFNQQV